MYLLLFSACTKLERDDFSLLPCRLVDLGFQNFLEKQKGILSVFVKNNLDESEQFFGF